MWTLIFLCALASPLYGSSISPEAREMPEAEKILPKAEGLPLLIPTQPIIEPFSNPAIQNPFVSPLVYYPNLPLYQRTLLARAEDSYGGSEGGSNNNNNNHWNAILECVRQNSDYQQYQQYYDQIYNYVNNFPSVITGNFPGIPIVGLTPMRDEKKDKEMLDDKKPEILQTRKAEVILPITADHKIYTVPAIPQTIFRNIDYVHPVNPFLPFQQLSLRARSIVQPIPITEQKEKNVSETLPLKAVPVPSEVAKEAALPEVIDA